MLAVFILIFGILSRLAAHAPNFTPVVALALFGGTYLPRRFALVVPLGLMMVSDGLIGFHDTLPYTWGAILIVSALGLRLRSGRRSVARLTAGGLAAALLFFAVTNFGAWLSLYPLTPEGFIRCYTLALPFFRMTLASTLLYGIVLFGGYEWAAARVKNTRWAPVLLAS